MAVRTRPRSRLWPDARQELLLRAALLAPPVAVDAWRRIEADNKGHALDAGSARLLPLVWSNLHRDGIQIDGLGARYQATAAANETLLSDLQMVLRELGGAGIPTIVLKGAAL